MSPNTHGFRAVAPVVGRFLKVAASLAITSFPAAACSADPPNAVRTQRLAKLGEITRICALPSGTLTLTPDNHWTIQPAPELTYSAISCTLEALQKAGIPPERIGFVAAPPPETEE